MRIVQTGQTEQITGYFRDLDGNLADPDTLIATVQRPDGTTDTYTYGTSANLTRASIGTYELLVSAELGRNVVQFVGTLGTYEATDVVQMIGT